MIFKSLARLAALTAVTAAATAYPTPAHAQEMPNGLDAFAPDEFAIDTMPNGLDAFAPDTMPNGLDAFASPVDASGAANLDLTGPLDVFSPSDPLGGNFIDGLEGVELDATGDGGFAIPTSIPGYPSGFVPSANGLGLIGVAAGGLVGGKLLGRKGHLPTACHGFRGAQIPVQQFDTEAALLVNAYHKKALGNAVDSVNALLDSVSPYACGTPTLFAHGVVFSRQHLHHYVRDAFTRIVGHAPEGRHENAWVNGLAHKVTPAALEQRLVTTKEFERNHPGRKRYVTALYEKILGRQPDAGGLAYWTNPKLTAPQIAHGIIHSEEARTRTAGGLYRDIMQREPDGPTLKAWAAKVDQGSFTRLKLKQALLTNPEVVNRAISETSTLIGGAVVPVATLRQHMDAHSARKRAAREQHVASHPTHPGQAQQPVAQNPAPAQHPPPEHHPAPQPHVAPHHPPPPAHHRR